MSSYQSFQKHLIKSSSGVGLYSVVMDNGHHVAFSLALCCILVKMVTLVLTLLLEHLFTKTFDLILDAVGTFWSVAHR